MSIVTVTNFTQSEFASTTKLAYSVADTLGTDRFIFGNRGGAQEWKYPHLAPATVTNADDVAGTLLSSAAAPADPAPILTLDAMLKVHRWIPFDKLDIEEELQLPASYGRRLGADLATARITRLLNYMMDVAFKAGQGNRAKDWDLRTHSTLGEQVAQALEHISGQMTTAGIPLSDRHCFLAPTLYNTLARVETAMKTTMGGDAVVAHPQRQRLHFADFEISTSGASFNLDFSSDASMDNATKYQTNNTVTGSGVGSPHGGFYGVAWHHDAFAVRHTREPMVRLSTHEEVESVLITARLKMGNVATQETGLWVLEDDDTSI